MTLDDEAIDRELAASVLRAFRENSGPRGSRDALFGNLYSSGSYFDAVADGSKVNVYIENPDNSGKVIFSRGSVHSAGQITYRKVDRVTVDTSGTTLASQNRRIDDGKSEANVEEGVTYSGGNAWTRKVTGGAISGGGLVPGYYADFDILLDEGQNVIYEVENVSGTEIKTSVDVDYVEISREEINELV